MISIYYISAWIKFYWWLGRWQVLTVNLVKIDKNVLKYRSENEYTCDHAFDFRKSNVLVCLLCKSHPFLWGVVSAFLFYRPVGKIERKILHTISSLSLASQWTCLQFKYRMNFSRWIRKCHVFILTLHDTSFIKLQHACSKTTKEYLWFCMFTLIFTIVVFLPSISIIAWAPISFSLYVQKPWHENNANRTRHQTHKNKPYNAKIIQYLWLNGLTLTATFTEAILLLKNSKMNRNI